MSANYPGANAKVVQDTVAAPIEQEVNGVENMLYMSSQSTNDERRRVQADGHVQARQFALTISASMLISAINAMTMTPARAVQIFKSREHKPGDAPGHEHVLEALP